MVDRILNEAPSIAVAVALAVFIITGDKDLAEQVADLIASLFAFAAWLHVRNNIDGPVTLYRRGH